MTQVSQREHNLVQQRELYGAPLGDTVRSVTAALAISQAALARTIGISAPMLSQLASGERIKLANPQAVERLHSLLDLVRQVEAGLPHDQVVAQLSAIEQDRTSTLTRDRDQHPDRATDLPAQFSRLLRAVASGRELTAAADLLRIEHPALAEVLRVYGTGTSRDADAHYATIAALVQP